jgi:hypothetical protein
MLQQLQEAASLSVGSASVMHCRDVLQALAGTTASDNASTWGVLSVADACRCLVVLLVQCGCLQQQHLAQQRGGSGAQGSSAPQHAPAAGGASADTSVDVLAAEHALPLDLEAQRPLVFVVQALHALLCPASGATHADTAAGEAAAATRPVPLLELLHAVVLPALLRPLLPVWQQQLHGLQAQLQAMADEAQQVLARPAQHAGDAGWQSGSADKVTSSEAAAAGAGAHDDTELPGLVRFDAFDMSLGGADMLLEGGLEDSDDERGGGSSGTGSGHGAGLDGGAAAAGLPDLVPFDAFDAQLAGAGELLDGSGLDEALESPTAAAAAAAAAAAEPGAGAGAAAGGGTPAAQQSDAGTGTSDDGAWRTLGQQLLCMAQAAAAAAQQQQQLEALQEVRDSCAWQHELWLRHLAAFEWLWEDLLLEVHAGQQQQGWRQLVQAAAAAAGCACDGAAGGPIHVGMPFQLYCQQQGLLPTVSSGGDSGHGSMPSRAQLLLAWQELCERQPAVAEGLAAWQAASGAAAAAVADALLLPQPGAPPPLAVADASVPRKMLSGHVARASHWLAAARGLLSGAAQLSEAALQLEYSRRGQLWAPGMPDGVDAFQGNAALMQQLTAAARALTEAQARGADAELLLVASRGAAAQAQATLAEAGEQVAAAQQQLAIKAPAAVARARGMLPVLAPMVAAAQAALPFVTDGLAAALRALTALVERNSAASDLGPLVRRVSLQHGRCVHVLQRLHDIGAAAAAGLAQVTAALQQQHQQPHQQQAGALLLAAASGSGGATAAGGAIDVLQLLLTHMQPALAGVREELADLGQAHVLFMQLATQLGSLAGAAETVAAAITSDHASMQQSTAGREQARGPAAAAKGSDTTAARQRAEARRRAFVSAALARCTARLTGVQQQREGRPQPATHPRTVQEEVAALVAASTSADKLCRMYEGWAAWL